MINIQTELLRTFVTAVDMESFTRAGETVGRTQSAISLQIRRLEAVLNAELFLRGTHRMRLTEKGTILLDYARKILALNDDAVRTLKRPSVAGCVRLGAPHEYTASLLPVILSKFVQSHPDVMLEVTCDLSKNLLARLEKKESDLVIALHDDLDAPNGIKIFTEPLVWVSNHGHVRSEKRPLPLIVAPEPCIYRNRVLQTLNRLGLPWRIAYTSSSYSGITAAVIAGLGVTVLAESTVPEGVRVMSERDGFPTIGHLEVRLHTSPEHTSDAVLHLADYIRKYLA